MAVNKGEIGIYGILRRDGGDGVLAKTDQIRDDNLQKTQKELNQDAVKGAETAAIHIANTSNPHNVTKAQLGLGNVDNTADANKSVKNADTVDGYHASVSNSPYGTIQAIGSNGQMKVGKRLEFHYNNTTGVEYSTTLSCAGDYSNQVYLPSGTGTLQLEDDTHAISYEDVLSILKNQ